MRPNLLITFFFSLFAFQSFSQIEEGLLLHYGFDNSYEDSSPNQFNGTPVDVKFTQGIDGTGSSVRWK